MGSKLANSFLQLLFGHISFIPLRWFPGQSRRPEHTATARAGGRVSLMAPREQHRPRPAALARAEAAGRALPPGAVAMEPGLEELMPRLLPVGDCDLAEDFDPTVPPRTPQEYLKRVQWVAGRTSRGRGRARHFPRERRGSRSCPGRVSCRGAPGRPCGAALGRRCRCFTHLQEGQVPRSSFSWAQQYSSKRHEAVSGEV